MSLTSLPPEILRHILLSPLVEYADLTACCLVCRYFWDIAAPILYRVLDFRTGAGVRSRMRLAIKRRQNISIHAIAANPKLGSFVQQFHNHLGNFPSPDGTFLRPEADILIKAAKNMTSLQSATLRPNPLTIEIVCFLNLYQQLSELSLHLVDPRAYVWPRFHMALTSLTWTFTRPASQQDPVSSPSRIPVLLNIVRATCPSLQSLNLKFISLSLWFPPKNYDRSLPYEDADDDTSRREIPQHLQHFAIRGSDVGQFSERDQSLLNDFLEDCKDSLTSLVIPIGWTWQEQKDTNIITSRCTSMLNLKLLELDEANISVARDGGHDKRFISELVEKLISLGIALESFTLLDIHAPFRSDIGRTFGSWVGLSYLHLGDQDNTGGPFCSGGMLDCEAYKPEILAFIKELPSSLEHLCLTVNASRLLENEIETFDPIWEVGPDAFCHLRRLHSLDILFRVGKWAKGYIKALKAALHFRRLPYAQYTDEGRVFWRTCNSDALTQMEANQVKTIWMSRMQSSSKNPVTHIPITLALSDDEGVFEGEDAPGIWWDGTPEAAQARNASTKLNDDNSIKQQNLLPCKVWPASQKTCWDYPLYYLCDGRWV